MYLCKGRDGRQEYGAGAHWGQMHMKAAVVDARVAYTGSANFTRTAAFLLDPGAFASCFGFPSLKGAGSTKYIAGAVGATPSSWCAWSALLSLRWRGRSLSGVLLQRPVSFNSEGGKR